MVVDWVPVGNLMMVVGTSTGREETSLDLVVGEEVLVDEEGTTVTVELGLTVRMKVLPELG